LVMPAVWPQRRRGLTVCGLSAPEGIADVVALGSSTALERIYPRWHAKVVGQRMSLLFDGT
jgi:hypothetical protein